MLSCWSACVMDFDQRLQTLVGIYPLSTVALISMIKKLFYLVPSFLKLLTYIYHVLLRYDHRA